MISESKGKPFLRALHGGGMGGDKDQFALCRKSWRKAGLGARTSLGGCCGSPGEGQYGQNCSEGIGKHGWNLVMLRWQN